MVGNRVAQGRAARVAVHFCWCVENWKCIAGGASRSMAKVGSCNSLSQVKEHLTRVACCQSVALAEGFMGPGVAEGRVAARSCVPAKSNSTGLSQQTGVKGVHPLPSALLGARWQSAARAAAAGVSAEFQ